MANNHLSNLASKGRYGDTEIAATSEGELWHVNPQEKSLMDMYGMEGERMVDAVGSGTKNPQTGLEEKFPWLIAAAVGSALVGASGAYSSGRAGELQAESERESADVGLKSIEEAIQRLEQSSQKGRAAVMTDYGQDVETESAKQGISREDLFQGTSKALEQSGLVKAGSVEQQSSLAWGRLRDRWTLKGESLLDTLERKWEQ